MNVPEQVHWPKSYSTYSRLLLHTYLNTILRYLKPLLHANDGTVLPVILTTSTQRNMELRMATKATVLSCLAAVTIAQFPAQATVATDYLLLRRNECPGGTFQCPASLGPAFSDVCCQNGQQCAVDNNDQPACCPSGWVPLSLWWATYG